MSEEFIVTFTRNQLATVVLELQDAIERMELSLKPPMDSFGHVQLSRLYAALEVLTASKGYPFADQLP